MAFFSPAARARPVLVVLAAAAVLSSGCAHARAERPEPPRAAATGADSPAGNLDASEEITSEELASIPEPPGTSARPATRPPAAADTTTPRAAPEAPGPRSTGDAPATPSEPPSVPSGPWIWRVQILATPDRALAERTAQEASERLGTVARIDTDPPLHKVRLGGFGSETDAQILKQRAVEMGYPGAFRVKIRVPATDE
jgi:hypothetical protein